MRAAGKIYINGSEYYGNRNAQQKETDQMQSQSGVEWTRLPLEYSGAQMSRKWHFYLRFVVCHENACVADADYAFRAIVEAFESEAGPTSSPPPH